MADGSVDRLRRNALIMVWDGLRPDMVSEKLTPRLHALAGAGTWFERSHSVVPPVTRCNSASLSTGTLPEHHGIPGNYFVMPRNDGIHLLNAADADHLEQLRPFRNGRLLLRRTLAELVSDVGGHTAIVGTGSPGAALLQHPQVRDGAFSGDAIYNHSLWLGSSREDVKSELGPMPEASVPNTEQNVYFTKLITDLLLTSSEAPALITFWHTDPDRTTHRHGVGHPDALRSLRDADRNLGTILDSLDATGRADSTNVIVTSDHGFATVTERVDVDELLAREGVKERPESSDVTTAGPAIYITTPGISDEERGRATAAVVRALQSERTIGSIFTGARGAPIVSGTLPLSAVGQGGDLAPDVLFSFAWSDAPNEHGYEGVRPGDLAIEADHGALSSWEMRNTLVAAGPDFRLGYVSQLPAGIVDVMPTLAHTMGIDPGVDVDGRVLQESLTESGAQVDGQTSPDPHSQLLERSAGAYRQRLQLSLYDGSTYVDLGEAART
ncbi:MAG TPA: alkaline phosphatase family protein [Dehalococcoidia bacterium]|nr:alkaline phosphatase family protein [Dehalococcoidia bacterium]